METSTPTNTHHDPGNVMANMTYYTAQCPRCRDWFHPNAADHHKTVCKQRPWARYGNPRTCSAPTSLLAHLDLLGTNATTPNNYAYIASPVEHVSARLWSKTADAAIQHGYDPATVINNMMTVDGWETMHTQFPITLIACPHCGEDVLETGLQLHTTKSARCLWLRADTEVTKLRTAGYTDPYALRPTIPLTWTALRTGPWRNTTLSVAYPKAIQAVLLRT
jgi:hypothetical protein